MPTLYVTEPGSRIEKEYERLLVTKEDQVLLAIPLTQVTEVVLMGAVGTTTPALLSLLDHGAGLTLISSAGRLRGRLIAAEARNLPLRHKQYARSSDAGFCLEISRAIVAGKLKNLRTLARRMVRGHRRSRLAGLGLRIEDAESQTANPESAPQGSQSEIRDPQPPDLTKNGGAGEGDSAIQNPRRLEERGEPPEIQNPKSEIRDPQSEIERLNAALDQVPTARELAELRGLEGSGSRAYFALLRAALRPDLTFHKRSRRPPGDPANALLSLAYTLLTQALFTACEVAGLDAYDGFFHADKYGRPALALDLVEEFRAIVADSVVLTVVNNRMLSADDFQPGGAERGGVYLSRRGLRVFVAQFGRRLNTPVFHPDAGRALSYQKIFEVQARRMRRCIEDGEPTYQPFLAK